MSIIPPLRKDLRRTDWPKFQACLEAGHLSDSDLPNEVAIDACVKKLTSAISKAPTDSSPKCRPLLSHGPQYQLVFSMKYA